MTQIFTGEGLGLHGSSLGLGNYGPKGVAALGQGGESVYINAANGNLVLKQADGFLADIGFGLDIFQTYNSRGEKGSNWQFNVQSRLEFKGEINAPGSSVIRIGEDGHRSIFTYNAQKQGYIPQNGGTECLTYRQNEWIYQNGGHKTSSHYNTKGQLTFLSDLDGHAFHFIYTDGQLSAISNNSSKQQITWSFQKGLLQDVITTSEGKTIHHVHYEYDGQNRLHHVSRDLGEGKIYWITYKYAGDSNRITDINQSDGTTLHIDYDTQGRVKKLIDGAGRVTSYTYEAGKTIITDGLGESWTYYYDDKNRLTGIDGPEKYRIRYQYEGAYLKSITQGNEVWNFRYNEQGDCIFIEEPDGKITRRLYNMAHHVISETHYQSFDGSHNPAQPQTTRYIYDEKGHLRFTIAADGTVTERRYDTEGQLLNTRCYLRSNYSLMAIDDENLPTMEQLQAWVAHQNPQDVSLVSYQYDWRGQLVEKIHYGQVDASGQGVLEKNSLRTRYCYDAAGRLIEKSTPGELGWSSTYYFYDDLGRLTQSIDNHHNTQRFEYDDTHQRIIETDANGLQTIRIYDGSGLLLSIIKVDATHNYGTISYTYDQAGRLISETGVDGLTAYTFYDAQGRIKAKVNTQGLVTEFQYNEEGQVVRTCQYEHVISTASWGEHLPSYDSVKPSAAPQDRISQTIYNQYNQLAYKIDSIGAVIAYRYDANGQMISTTAFANKLSDFNPKHLLTFNEVRIKDDSKDRTNSYYYDSMGRLQGEINGEGYAVAYTYDRLGNLIESCRYLNRSTERSGNWQKDKPAATSQKDIHTYRLYDNQGLKIAEIDGERYLTEYRYDGRGLLIERCAFENAVSKSIIIDETTILDHIRPATQTNDHHTFYQYNELGQVVSEKNQGGRITTYTYDSMGHILTKTNSDEQNHAIRQQQYRYDSLGRVINSLDEMGSMLLAQSGLTKDQIEQIWQHHSIHFEYDNAGLLHAKKDALNQTTLYFYDESRQLKYTVNADGSVMEHLYNPFNQLVLSKKYSAQLKSNCKNATTHDIEERLNFIKDDRLDETTRYKYNSIGQLIAKYIGSDGIVTTEYNTFGEIEKTTQRIDAAHNKLTAFSYDKRGLLTRNIVDPHGIAKDIKLQYDSFGWLIQESDSKLNKTSYTLNKRGEQIIITNASTNLKMIQYDAFGRELYETNSGGNRIVKSFSYNDQANTLILNYSDIQSPIITKFNAFGDQISIKDANGYSTEFHYDEKGQLIRIDSPENTFKEYQYDAEGQLRFEQNAGGQKIAYSYDAAGHLLTKTIDPDGLKLTTSYRYDGVGRQLQITEANGRIKEFKYDNKGNLIQSCIDPYGLNLITTFAYDDRGLLLRQTEINSQGEDRVTAYEWDPLGRRTASIIDPDGLKITTTYQYDANDNLIRTTDANQHSIHFIYDAMNRCRYQIDPRGVVSEYRYDREGNKTQSIIYAQQIPKISEYDDASVKGIIKEDIHDQHTFQVFNNKGQIIAGFDARGYATGYRYDGNGNLITTTRYAKAVSLEELKKGNMSLPLEEQARKEYFIYDGLNQLRFKRDNSGHVTESSYNLNGELIRTTHYAESIPTGNIESITLSYIENHLTRQPERDQSIHYGYDKAGRLITELSAQGVAKSHQYDTTGLLIGSTIYATPIDPSKIKNLDHLQLPLNPKDRTRYFVYDVAGRERYRISPEGRVLERKYDAVGNIAAELTYSTPIHLSVYSESSITQILNGNSAPYKLTQYQYDVAGRLTTQQQGQTQTEYTYDAQGNVLTKTDANSAVTHYFYNETNQLIETHTPPILVSGVHGQEKRSVVTRNSYDSFGNIISIVRDAEGLKQTLLYEYDTGNNKIKTIYPNGAVNNAKPASSRQRQEVNRILTEEIKYNGFGQVIASSDKSGNWKYFIYDSNQGLLCYSVDNLGGVIEHKYDSFNRIINKSVYANPINLNPNTNYSIESIASMIHSGKADRHEFYAYNRDNQLIESSRDSVPTFNAKTGHYDHLKPTTLTTYNTFGEVIKTAVRINETEWAQTYNYYDKDGHLSALIDAAGYVTTYTQNGYGETEAITEYAFIAPYWDEENYTRPQSSNKDRIVVFTYDALGQITSKTLKQVQYERRKGTSSVYESFISDITTTYTYDALGHMTSTTDGKGNTSNWYYDEMGQLIAKIAPKTQDGRGATTYSYDGLGNLVETRRWSLGVSEADTKQFKLKGSSTSDNIIRQEYDLDNNLISETDALNHSTYYSYDANGNLARSWQEFKQPNQQTLIQDKRYRYDKENRLIQTATFKNNDAVKTEDVKYNTFGEVTAKGINGNYNTHVDYDCLGRVWRSNTQGFYQIYVYDLMDHVTQVVTSTNSWRPDKSNRGVDLSAAIFEEVTIYDELSWHYDLQRQNNTYDMLGRLVQQSKEFAARSWDEGIDDRLENITQSQTVDRWGNMSRFINAMGYETRYEYNAYNQVIKQELPEVRVVDEHGVSRLLKPVNTYAYDELGQAIAMIDANGHSVSKEYDALGRVIKETDAKGYSRSKHYNLLDQLTSATNESGGITTYAYDQMNRLVSVTTPKTRQDYEYNELGQLIKQKNGQQEETQFWYDTLGNQITQRDARSYDTHFQYDDSGRKINQTDAMGRSQSWNYSADGRLTQHTDMGGHTSYYQYNTNGTLIEEHSTTGKRVEYHYRGNGDLYQYADIAQQEVINYSYDAAGQVIIKESGKGGSGKTGWIKEIDHYQYDALGRLNQVRRQHPDDTDNRFPDQDHALLSIDYDYDAVGNIRHTKVNANYTGYEQVQNEDYYLYDENNRMTVNKGKLINGEISINNSQGSAITYDAVGNIHDAEKYENGQVQHYHYQYNLENQLELIQKNSRSIQAKIYDRAGRVIQENLFDEYGNLAQKNLAAYEKGLLIAQSIKNSNDWEVSKTVFQYDRAGNMEDLSMRVNTAPGTRGYNLRHQYSYALWDNYQQSSDIVTRTIDGQAATSGRSTRSYDLNGQLIYSTDHDAGGGPSNSTSYWTSSVEGIKAREDKDGKTSYLSVGGKTIGDLRLDVYGKQHLTVYGGFTPSGSQRKAEPENFLWQTDHTAGTIGAFLERSPGDSADGALPESTQDNLGTYTLQAGDTLESIALLAYGDSSLWYLIADANGISDRSAQASNGGPLHIGQRINLPAVASSQHQTNRTHKVINATQMIGDTSATAPMPATPPPLPRHHNRIFSRIIVGIISVVTTVLTAGIVGAMLGAGSMLSGISSLFALGSKVLAGGALLETGGAMAAGFAAGFVGNIAGQGAAKAFGMQEHIDFKNAFVSGLATAATAGFSKIVPPNSAYNSLVKSLDNAGINKNFSIASAAEMMEQNAASQVFNVTLRRHQHFDWEELGVTGLTAGLMGGTAGQELNQTIKKIDKTGILENQLSTLTRATLQSHNTTHFDATQVLIDNLGSAIGSKLLSTLNPEISSNETLNDELYLSETLLDITHPERQEKAVYQNYLAQLLANNSNGYDSDSLEFKSDLLKSDSTSETFENRVYWGEKHGKDQFVSEALAGLDTTGLIFNFNEQEQIIYQDSPYTFEEAVDLQMSLTGTSAPKVWLGLKNKTWGNASYEQVRRGMDVESLFANPIDKMQFLDLHYQEGFKVDDLNALLNKKGVLHNTGNIFLNAAKENNLNPLYLIAHALHESGNGVSPLAFEKNSFFGLGANDTAAKIKGGEFATEHGWTSVEKGIRGGAKIISKIWINNSSNNQSTLYSMRWNPINPGTSQYATDYNWASAQTKKIYPLLNEFKQINPSYQPLLIIPRYKNWTQLK